MQSSDSFRNHPLWETLQTIEEENKYRELDPPARHYLVALLEELKKRRDSVNRYFVSANSLDNLNNLLANIRIYTPSNPSHVAQYVTEAFSELSSRWPAHNGRFVADVSKATFDRIVGELADDLTEARASVDKVKELEEAYDADAQDIKQNLHALKENVEASIANVEQDAKTKLDALDNAYKQDAEERKMQNAEAIQKIRDEFIAHLKAKDEEASRILEEVQNTSNAASGKVVADSYGEYATQKEHQTKTYDILAIIFAIVGVALVGFALIWLHADETSATVFKMAASVASFVVSGYLFRRGSFCQREAKAAKRTELTLKQYRAFIANLDDDEKKRITTEVAERIFIRGEIDDNTPTMTEALAQRGLNEKQLKTILELLKTIGAAQC